MDNNNSQNELRENKAETSNFLINKEKHPLDNNSSVPNKVNNSQGKSQQPVKFDNINEELQYYKDKVTKCLKLINYQDSQIKQLQTKLKQFEIEEGKKYELIFKLKYEQITFFFFKTENNLYFVHEKVLDEEFKKVLFSNENIKTYDYLNDIVKREETINLMMKQYEDRMNRLNTELVNSENKFFQANKNYKNSMKEVEDYKKTFDDLKISWENCIKEVIQTRYKKVDFSSDISNQMNNLSEVDLSDEVIRKQVFNEIKEEINKFSSQHEHHWLNELRVCISKIFLSFLEIANKNLNLERHIESQKEKFQMTLDQTINMNEEEFQQKNKIIDSLRNSIQELKLKINNLENEKYNIARQKDQTIEILNKEINKGVNVNYLKNILLSFITTSDESIQNKLLPVIFTTLQFNETEMKKVEEFRSKKSIFNIFS